MAVVASFLLCQSAHAALVLESQFVGYGSGALGADVTTGTLDGWQLSTPEVFLTEGSGSLTGTNLGLVVSAGDRVFTSTNSAGCRNQFVPSGTFPQGNETNIYYSWLYKFNDAADVDPAGVLLFRVTRGNSGINNDHHWNVIARSVGNQIQLGLSKAGGTATNYATTNISAGETIFVVVRQHIIPGVTNDIYDLWINPPASSFGADEGSVPPSSATVSEGAEDQSGTGPGRFVVRSGANTEFDELRIATTWAEATPYFGQCIPAGVSAGNPASVTMSAELAATFQVFEKGTSPQIQWQLSTNSGSTWDDIAFATTSTYRTPNLPLSADGNQYRAIVSVDCNGSSATSEVATVTLTAPAVTPNGIVMDDTFLDPDLGFDDRANEPLTSSNSLWYTATTDNLTAFGQGGNLLGIPTAGSSSLWLGYFIATNEPPVHLDVGRAIKVTMPFTPNSFTAQTGNGSLRIGLFDYFDAGTRITVDGPNVGGSQGNATGVRGYMLNLNFGQTFTDNTPLDLFARTTLQDFNLMGSSGDYTSIGSGPTGGAYSGAPAFQAGTEYNFEFTVARTAVDSIVFSVNIAGGGTNWSFSATDDTYAYHRFDSFAIRPNNLEGTADSFTFPFFKVEVIEAVIPVTPFDITEATLLSPNELKLTWDSVDGTTYDVLSRDSITGTEITNATIMATGNSTSYTNSPISGAERYFRVVAR